MNTSSRVLNQKLIEQTILNNHLVDENIKLKRKLDCNQGLMNSSIESLNKKNQISSIVDSFDLLKINLNEKYDSTVNSL